MENAHSLSEARSIWQHTKNTAAFNFLIGSSSDAMASAAMALETMENFTVLLWQLTGRGEARWKWPNTSVPEKIGFQCVMLYGDQIALQPFVMRSQENLWNDTVWRYMELHDLIKAKAALVTVEDVTYIVSVLGIKVQTIWVVMLSNLVMGAIMLWVYYDPSNYKLYSRGKMAVSLATTGAQLRATIHWV